MEDLRERIIGEAVSAMVAAEKACGTPLYPYHAGRIAALRAIYGDRVEFKARVMADPREAGTWENHF